MKFNTIFIFRKNKTFLSSLLFYLVLSSWYVLRPLRNELAVESYGEGMLIPLLISTTLVMILVNPIYSWVASRGNYIRIVFYTYSFFIFNLALLYLYSSSLSQTMVTERLWLGRIFYVWSNIYSFFTVSIFWVLVINLFRDSSSRKYYGFILAGGSVGAMLGSQTSSILSNSFTESGIALFLIAASFFLLLALALATYMVRAFSIEALSSKVGGGSIDSIKNILTKDDIRNIAIYSWFFTFLMTVQWIAAIPIIENYSELSPERIRLFALIEQIVSPLTLIVQLTLTYYVISKFGIKFILIVYGILFVVVFSLYGFFPSVGIVILCQTSLRVFEYGFNKPAREIAYSQLEKRDRYKTTVFIDTFMTRFGDLSGSVFMGIGKSIFLSITYMPIAAIPFAIFHAYLGWSITKKNLFKDL
jgi:AAA family ATP:ADP antiporter